MLKNAKIFVAGHRGLVGSALVSQLRKGGFTNLLLKTHQELDLRDEKAVDQFFEKEKPEYVFLAAAKVGGIAANNDFPVDFIVQNIKIQTAVIQACHKYNVQRLLFLGSSCIYPKLAPQPMKEEHLLTGELEPTNRPYAIAKISGIEMCWAYNRQYQRKFLAVMPTNLYGPNDNYDLQSSHVLPALIRKFHEAKVQGASEVEVWGTGRPKREFLYSEDLADAGLFLMSLPDEKFNALVSPEKCPLLNVGVGEDLSILELVHLVQKTVGYSGELKFNTNKPDGTPRKLMDVTKINALGWKAATSLQIGIGKAYADFLQKLDKA